MPSEFSHDQNVATTGSDRRASEATGNGSHTAERRAVERRQEQHPIQIAVFGGLRSSDKATLVARRDGVGPLVGWFASITFILVAWLVSLGGILKSGSGLGYYFGLVGGVMMLLMLLYPIRKHMSWARSWGPLRYWFMLHMVFGIGGPVLVMFHSTFHVKSLNARVAFYSMLLVAASGIIGRFIYKHIHHGLYGRKSNLEELQHAVDANQNKMDHISAILLEASGVGEKLKQFRIMAMVQKGIFPILAWQFMTLGWRRHNLTGHCRKELERAIAHLAQSQGWNKQYQDQRFQAATQDVEEYLSAVQQAAQFSSYERLFRLWHVLHSPFVWLLAISGIVHVIATQFMY